MADASISWSPANPLAGKTITAGTGSFSTIPTIAEINAATWLNQIIATITRRESQYFQTPPTPLNYVASGDLCTPSMFNDIMQRIRNLGLAIFQDYFPTSLSAGNLTARVDIQGMRAALDVISTGVGTYDPFYSGLSYKEHKKVYNAFGVLISETDVTAVGWGGGNYIGVNALTYIRRGFYVPYPTNIITSMVPSITYYGGGNRYWPNATEKMAIYASNTDDYSFPSGWQTNLNVLLCEFERPISPAVFTTTIPNSVFQTGNQNISFIMGNKGDIDGTGATLTDGGSTYGILSVNFNI